MGQDRTKSGAFLVLTGLIYADVLLTVKGVSTHGLSYEANPLMRYVIDSWGPAAFTWIKALPLLPLGVYYRRVPNWLWALLIILMMLVVTLGVFAQ